MQVNNKKRMVLGMTLAERLVKAVEVRKSLVASITNADTKEALDKIELDLRKADIEIEQLEMDIAAEQRSLAGGIQGQAPRTVAVNGDNQGEGGNPEQRSYTPGMGFQPLAQANLQQRSLNEDEDPFDTLEYRNAFKEYVVKGTPIPEQFTPTPEMRSDQLTVTDNIGAVIPTTIMNRVITEATKEGKILQRVTQTAFQGGVSIPKSDLKPVATWISETTKSDEQKADVNASIVFGYHLLEAKIALSLVSSVVSLAVFESTIIKSLKAAMIRAIEAAIISGDGNGKPKGLTTIVTPADRTVEMTVDEIGTVRKWAEPESAIPEAYEDKGIYLMNKKTWEKYLNAMVDSTGQKIGLGRINEKGEKRLNGRLVETVEYMKSFDAAVEGDVIAMLVDLEEYCLNSNLNMSYKKYWDEENNKYVHKSLMIVDGKMADDNGLVIIKKK